jgi:DNA-binding LacI/PurR family transcriptional regulator
MEKPTLPNYQRIKQELMEDIARGHYAPDQVFITQQEACQRFQVSRITAERAINELVRDGILLRRRGQGTFVAQTSTPTQSGPKPFADTRRVIACIVSVTRSEHKTAIIRGVSDACREADCHLLFFDSNERAEIEAVNLQRALKAGVQGIIIYPVDGYPNTDVFVSLLQEGMPLVMVDRYYPHLSTDIVVPDHVAAGYEITKWLIEQGHKTIATIWQEVGCTASQERLIGYKQALREAHLQIDSNLATLRSYAALGEEERCALLASWLRSAHPPTVLLAVNSYILGIVWRDLLSLGVPIGENLVLAAMDKDETGVPLMPDLAGMALPSYEMGREAMRILLSRFQHDQAQTPSRHVVLPVTLRTPSSLALPASLTEAS